ncbi:hypothetical protein [Actinoplanes sp. M2I2]|uniref:hypothetical protein n=1 Tax=Actinoplanes sp. M2I2 TaxID=1734444 RepID=UPI00201FC72B|nr:hypothetical protein [Actinoplanes sp. M2I2]
MRITDERRLIGPPSGDDHGSATAVSPRRARLQRAAESAHHSGLTSLFGHGGDLLSGTAALSVAEGRDARLLG